MEPPWLEEPIPAPSDPLFGIATLNYDWRPKILAACMAMNIPHELNADHQLTLSSNLYKFISSYEVHRRAMLALQRPGFDYCGCTEIAARAGPATKICFCSSQVTMGQPDAKSLSPKNQGLLIRLFWNLEAGEKERPGRIPRDYIPHHDFIFP